MRFSDLCYIDDAGYHYADYPTFLQWVQDSFRGIYGSDVNLAADTQDGQWAAFIAQGFFDCAAQGASVYNSFSPAFAQGSGLARNVKINGISKRKATNSTVDLTIIGQANTVITNGIAKDTNGVQWLLPSPLTIPSGGSIVATATCATAGAVSAQANTVTTIATPTNGWQSVNNVSAANPGIAIETDAALRFRQKSSVALPSLTVFEGTKGAVLNVAGVTKSVGYENYTKVADGNGIPGNSICMVVQGGAVLDIATAIAKKKTPGSGTFGEISQVVSDQYGMPLTINFKRPTLVPIQVRVTVASKAGWTSDYIAQIQNAIANTINGNNIGDTLYITKLYPPAYLPGTAATSTFNIVLIEISRKPNPFGTANLSMAFNELATCAVADITMVVS